MRIKTRIRAAATFQDYAMHITGRKAKVVTVGGEASVASAAAFSPAACVRSALLEPFPPFTFAI